MLCFDLKSHLQSTAGELVLWVINTNEVVVDGLTMPYVPYSTESENGASNVLSKFITVGTVSGKLNCTSPCVYMIFVIVTANLIIIYDQV